MIDFDQMVLALLQGFTELLPVFSSAHLLLPLLLQVWPDQGLAFDVAVYAGTLSALLWLCRDGLVRIANRWLRSRATACDDSRGITMTATTLLDMIRQSAASFSFLLSIPFFACAWMLKVRELVGGDASIDWLSLGLGVAVTGISAYSCIATLLRLFDNVAFMPFVYSAHHRRWRCTCYG